MELDRYVDRHWKECCTQFITPASRSSLQIMVKGYVRSVLAIAIYCCIIVCQGMYNVLNVVLLFGMREETVVPRENPLVLKKPTCTQEEHKNSTQKGCEVTTPTPPLCH